jgi:plastocyanin
MTRIAVPFAILALALAAAVGGNAATAKDSYDLKGEVYGNSMFKIEMKNRAGRKLTSVKAGTYRIKIEDMASVHNFRLTGPGVNKATSLGGRIETVWTVRLRPGKYTFVCDPHADRMRGSFRVTR